MQRHLAIADLVEFAIFIATAKRQTGLPNSVLITVSMLERRHLIGG
jgi:hypothetical protein